MAQRMVKCVKLHKELPGLEEPPGLEISASASMITFPRKRGTSGSTPEDVINEYRLVLRPRKRRTSSPNRWSSFSLAKVAQVPGCAHQVSSGWLLVLVLTVCNQLLATAFPILRSPHAIPGIYVFQVLGVGAFLLIFSLALQAGPAPDGGGDLFKQKCSMCPWRRRQRVCGLKTPDFTDPKVQASLTDKEIVEPSARKKGHSDAGFRRQTD